MMLMRLYLYSLGFFITPFRLNFKRTGALNGTCQYEEKKSPELTYIFHLILNATMLL